MDGIVGQQSDGQADRIVGASGDVCSNTLTNIYIRRASLARPVSIGSSRMVTTGSRRGSAGRRTATTSSPQRMTTRTTTSILSRKATATPGRLWTSSSLRSSAAVMGVQKQTALHGLLGKQTNYLGRGLQDQSQAKLCQGTEFSVASQSGPGGKRGKECYPMR